MVQNNSSDSRIHVDGKYNASKRCSEVIKDLGLIFELDKDSEKKINTVEVAEAFGCFAMAVSGFVILGAGVAWADDMDSGVFAKLGFIVFFIGLVVYLISIFRKGIIIQDEFSDYRYKVARDLIPLLDTDIDSNSNVKINLNLKEFPVIDQSGKNKKRKTKNPKGERQHQTTQESILTLSGRFRDGTKFNYEITEHTLAYGEWFYYRAISGKTKTKLRAKKRTKWIGKLRLRFKDKQYDTSSISIPELEGFAQMPEGTRLKKVKTGDSELTMVSLTDTYKEKKKFKPREDIDFAWRSMKNHEEQIKIIFSMSAMMFLSLYQALHSCSVKS